MKRIILLSSLFVGVLLVAVCLDAQTISNIIFDAPHHIITAGNGLMLGAAIMLAPVKGEAKPGVAVAAISGPVRAAGMTDAAVLSEAINNLSNASANSSLVDRGSLKHLIPNPTNTTMIVTNSVGSGAAAIVAQMFNEDFLLSTPSDNGSGGASVVKSYNDGFGGNLINRIIASKGDNGLQVKQLQIEMTTDATGLQNASAVKNASPTVTAYNGDLSSLPQNIPLGTTGTPSYQQPGFLIINVNFVIQRFAQMSFNVPVGVTAAVTIVYG